MELLGIGLPELLFIALILLLVLGPTELVTLGRKSGQLIRRIRQSDTWNMVSNLAQALRNLPTALADEARAEEIFGSVVSKKDSRTIAPPDSAQGSSRTSTEPAPGEAREGFSAWTAAPTSGTQPPEESSEENPDTGPSGASRQ